MPKRPDPLELSVRDFFFKDGDLSTLRKETVTRAELWAILSWYEKQQRQRRSLWGRFRRALRNVPTVNPFEWANAQRKR